MTIFELFPWLLAASVATLTGVLLSRAGLSGAAVWIISVPAGIASFAAYWVSLRLLVARSQRQRTRKEKQDRENRKYQDFDLTKSFPVGGNLFYECRVCGNVIPSTATNGVGCKCRNIVVDANSGRLEIQDQTKVKLFSRITA